MEAARSVIRSFSGYPRLGWVDILRFQHFDNEVSANQFKVTIWRITQKSNSSTQKKPLKDSNTIQKNSNTIPKSDITTQKKPLKDSRTIQKDSATIQKNDSTIQKNLDSLEEVLKFLIENPKATSGEMVDAISNLFKFRKLIKYNVTT